MSNASDDINEDDSSNTVTSDTDSSIYGETCDETEIEADELDIDVEYDTDNADGIDEPFSSVIKDDVPETLEAESVIPNTESELGYGTSIYDDRIVHDTLKATKFVWYKHIRCGKRWSSFDFKDGVVYKLIFKHLKDLVDNDVYEYKIDENGVQHVYAYDDEAITSDFWCKSPIYSFIGTWEEISQLMIDKNIFVSFVIIDEHCNICMTGTSNVERKYDIFKTYPAGGKYRKPWKH